MLEMNFLAARRWRKNQRADRAGDSDLLISRRASVLTASLRKRSG
jgi:hypothetical protein